MADSIPKQVLQQLKQVGQETVEKATESAGKILVETISPKELLGTIQPMSDQEYAQKKAEDDQKKQAEIQQLAPRNVEGEIKEVRNEKQQKEEEAEKAMLENIRRQREAEEMERAQMAPMASNAQRDKAKASQQPHGKKKAQMPDPSQMSQTSEFKGKID